MRSVTVVVIHHEAPEWCRDTVESLLGADGVLVKVVVVHNGGELPPLPAGVEVLVPDRNRGYSGGANAGLARWLASSDESWVGVASHDVALEPGALASLVALGESSDDIGIVGPSMSGGLKEGGGSLPVDTAWVSGSLMLVRRRCLLEVGRFDERFASYVEDVDYGMRAGRAGWRVVADPTIHARHRGSASSDAPALTTANHELLAILGGRGWPGRLRLAALAAASGARRVVSPRHGPYARARWRALVASCRRPRLAWERSVVARVDRPSREESTIGPKG